MRILRRQEFLLLPVGTLYARGKPWAFDNLQIKGETIGNDWECLSPIWIESNDDAEQWGRLTAMLEGGASFPMQTSYGRDGRFCDDDLFLVLERDDLVGLRMIVDEALSAE